MRTLTAPKRCKVGIRELYSSSATIAPVGNVFKDATARRGESARSSASPGTAPHADLEISRRHNMAPLWDPWWNPVLDTGVAKESYDFNIIKSTN
jgi:hypothetical protein